MSRTLAVCALLAVLTGLGYAGVGELGFISLDDVEYVTANSQVQQGLTAESLGWAFRATTLGNWHPLTWLSHMAAWELGGPDPRVHHGLNLLLHLANVILLFLVLRAATGDPGPSAFLAGLFAIHPLHVESVAWVAERKDVLSTLFWILALAAYLAWVRRPGPGRYAVLAACLALGLMSKPMLVTLPFALLLLDLWPLDRPRRIGLLVEKLPLFAVVAVFSGVTFWVQRQSGAVGSLEDFGLVERLANATLSYGVYLRQTLWPGGLAVFYPFPHSPALAQALASGLLLVGASVAAWRLLPRLPFLFVGWFWFLGTLVPVIGLVQVGTHAHADRYTYVPHIGLFAATAWGLSALARRLGAPGWLRAGLAAALLAALVPVTRAQVATWKDDFTLFGHALEVTEDNYLAHLFVGEAHRRQGRWAEAGSHLQRAVEIRPQLAVAHNNLGIVRFMEGDPDEAIRLYRTALELEPDYAEARNNLGVALLRSGETEPAVEAFREALRRRADYPEARLNLARALTFAGRGADAVRSYREALREAEESGNDAGAARALRGLVGLLASHPDAGLRDGAQAVPYAERVLELDPSGHPVDLDGLAQAYAEVGRFGEAIQLTLQALQRTPGEERDLRRGLRERLALYRSGEPYRLAPSPPGAAEPEGASAGASM